MQVIAKDDHHLVHEGRCRCYFYSGSCAFFVDEVKDVVDSRDQKNWKYIRAIDTINSRIWYNHFGQPKVVFVEPDEAARVAKGMIEFHKDYYHPSLSDTELKQLQDKIASAAAQAVKTAKTSIKSGIATLAPIASNEIVPQINVDVRITLDFQARLLLSDIPWGTKFRVSSIQHALLKTGPNTVVGLQGEDVQLTPGYIITHVYCERARDYITDVKYRERYGY